MKKIISVVLLAAMVLSLVACGTNKTTGTNETDNKIVWVCYGPKVRESEKVETAINEYLADKIGQKVDMLILTGNEYAEKLQMMIASNERVDLCFSASYVNFNSNVSKNFYMPMDEYFEEYGKDIKALYPDYVYKSGIVNGEMYALPAWKDFSYELSIGYVKQGAVELGMNPESIKSFEDLEPYLEAFKKKYPKEFPVAINSNYTFFGTLGYIPLAGDKAVGSMKIDGNDGKVVNPYEQADTLEFMKLMHKWYNKGYIRTDAATSTGDIVMKKGKALINISQMLPYQRQVANLSKAPDEQCGDIQLWEPWLVSTAGSMQSIPRTAKNPEGAMKFLNLLNTDATLRNLVALGIEGEHYENVDEFHYRFPDGKKRDDMGYYTWPYTQGNVYLTKQIEGTPDDIYEKYQEFDDRAVQAQNFGFSFNGDDFKTEVAAIGNVYSEYIPALITGSVDPEEYLPKALKEFEAAGIDTLIDEMQRQYDEWKKTSK